MERMPSQGKGKGHAYVSEKEFKDFKDLLGDKFKQWELDLVKVQQATTTRIEMNNVKATLENLEANVRTTEKRSI